MKEDRIKVEESILKDLISQQESINTKVSELYEREKTLPYGQEKDDVSSERMNLRYTLRELVIKIRNQKNIISALQNGGELKTFTDKKGLDHKDVPDFTKVDTEFISFTLETILSDPHPIYIPLINEETFAAKGYIFDAIRIDKDTYILATNGYRENKQHAGLSSWNKPPEPAEEFEQGYVIATLDQLALINDFYYTKAKATISKEADEKNKRAEVSYDNLPVEKRERYFNQEGYYQTGLPISVKKKINEEQWNKLSLSEKEAYYKPIRRVQGKRLVSKLEDKQMWHSFHFMYERFINPEAKNITKEGVVSDKRTGYGNPETFSYWYEFRDRMKWKIKDIAVQRQVISEMRSIALETSFGESNINNVLKEEYGISVKRQNGEAINVVEIDQIRNAWTRINALYGNVYNHARERNLKISHTGKTLVFASKAAGMYIPDMQTIAVSNKFGDNQFETIFAHETAHWIDNISAQIHGKRYNSDNFESAAGVLASTFRKHMNEQSDSDYINSTKECFARAMEQYFAIETFGDDASLIYSYTKLDEIRTYFTEGHYVNKQTYYNIIKPLAENFLRENKSFFGPTIKNESKMETGKVDVYYKEPKIKSTTIGFGTKMTLGKNIGIRIGNQIFTSQGFIKSKDGAIEDIHNFREEDFSEEWIKDETPSQEDKAKAMLLYQRFVEESNKIEIYREAKLLSPKGNEQHIAINHYPFNKKGIKYRLTINGSPDKPFEKKEDADTLFDSLLNSYKRKGYSEIKNAEPMQEDKLINAVSQYGWRAEKTADGYDVFNSKDKKVVTLKVSGNKFSFWDQGNNKLMSGTGNIDVAIGKLLEQYYFAKRIELKPAEEMKTHKSYKEAIKLPKGGAVDMDADNINASAAESIASKHAMRPEAIYDWANKHGVELSKAGYVLSKPVFNTELMDDILNDKYESTKNVIESYPKIKSQLSTAGLIADKYALSQKEVYDWANKFDVDFMKHRDIFLNPKYEMSIRSDMGSGRYFAMKKIIETQESSKDIEKKFKIGDSVEEIAAVQPKDIYIVMGHGEYNEDYGWETVIENAKTGKSITMFENLLETAMPTSEPAEKAEEKKEEIPNYEITPALTQEFNSMSTSILDAIKNANDKRSRSAVDKLINELTNFIDENPALFPDFIIFIYSIPKKHLVGQRVYDVDLGMPGVEKWLKATNKNLLDVMPLKEYKLPKYRPFETKHDDKTFMSIQSLFAGNDELRPVMFGTNFNAEGVVTTNAHILIFAEYRGGANKDRGTYCYTQQCFTANPEGEIEGKYPNWSNVIPSNPDRVVINAEAMYDYLKNMIALEIVPVITNGIALEFVNSKGEKVIMGFNGKFLLECLEGMSRLGHKDLEMSFSEPNRAAMIYPIGKSSSIQTRKTDFCLIMPVMLNIEIMGRIIVGYNSTYNIETNCVTFTGNDTTYCFDGVVKEKQKMVKDIEDVKKENENLRGEIEKAKKEMKAPRGVFYAKVKPLKEGMPEQYVRVKADESLGMVTGYFVYKNLEGSRKEDAHFYKQKFMDMLENGEYTIISKEEAERLRDEHVIEEIKKSKKRVEEAKEAAKGKLKKLIELLETA